MVLFGAGNHVFLTDTDPPTVTLAPVDVIGSDFDSPYLDLDITFSAPVVGFIPQHVAVDGDADPTFFTLTPVQTGTQYRFRLTGFNQSGDLTVQIPEGVVTGVAPPLANAASSLISLTYAPPVEDDLAEFSDEFNDASTLASWLRNDTAEGWNADKLEQWDIDQSQAGRMRLMPYASSWYQDFAGVHVYREVSGDFVVTIELDVFDRSGTGRPNSDFSLAGILIRAPSGVTSAAPHPDPGPETVLPWPPPDIEQPNHYVTDWSPGNENYIFLSYGFASSDLTQPDGNNPNRWHYEVKTTSNSVSTLYPRTHGVPENEPNATLQIIRRSGTFLLLRRHGDGPWIIENRFERPDLPSTLNVGITTYTDWNTVAAGWNFSSAVEPFHQNRIVNTNAGSPDLIADVDYVRLRRPDPELDLVDLQTVEVTGEGAWNGIIYLTNTTLAPYLGNAAAEPVEPAGITYPQWIARHLSPAELANPSLTDPATALGSNGLLNVFAFLFQRMPIAEGSDSAWADGDNYLTYEGGTFPDEGLRLRIPRNPLARGWRLEIEASTNLLYTWSTIATSDHGAPAVGSGVVGDVPGDPPIMILRPDSGQDNSPTLHFRTRATPLPIEP